MHVRLGVTPAGVDAQAARDLRERVVQLRDEGRTVLLTTLYMEEADQLCDRIAIMDRGQVIAFDTPEGLIRALPQDAVVSATIPAGGRVTIAESDLRGIPGVTGATVTQEPERTVLKAATGDVQATLVGMLQLADARGIALGELSSTRANLEDVFLALTGRTMEAHPDGPVAEPEKKRRRRGGG